VQASVWGARVVGGGEVAHRLAPLGNTQRPAEQWQAAETRAEHWAGRRLCAGAARTHCAGRRQRARVTALNLGARPSSAPSAQSSPTASPWGWLAERLWASRANCLCVSVSVAACEGTTS